MGGSKQPKRLIDWEIGFKPPLTGDIVPFFEPPRHGQKL